MVKVIYVLVEAGFKCATEGNYSTEIAAFESREEAEKAKAWKDSIDSEECSSETGKFRFCNHYRQWDNYVVGRNVYAYKSFEEFSEDMHNMPY